MSACGPGHDEEKPAPPEHETARGGGGRPAAKIHWADRIPGRIGLGLVIPGLVIFAWWLGIKSGTAVVPTFGEVFHVLLNPFDVPEGFYSSSLAFSAGMTILRLILGFGLGVVTAVPLGLLAGRSRVVERLLDPAVQMARPINPIVLLPIATVAFGLASLATFFFGGRDAWQHEVLDQVQIAMLVILWWGTFFPVFISTMYGVRSVRTAYIEGIRLMGGSEWQCFRYIVFPHALPYAANGMRLGMGVAWLVLIAAETFPGTRSGLGYMLCVACKTIDYEYTFAALIVIALVALMTDMAIARFERASGHWQATQRR